MRTMVLGDIHGRHEALVEVLAKCNFDYDTDNIIILGDVVDGGRETKECVDELLKIKNKVLVLGNHDDWFIEWFKGGPEIPVWIHQGGLATLESYNFSKVPKAHKEFFEAAVLYFVDDNNNLYVHGGFNDRIKLDEQRRCELLWDRTIIDIARVRRIKGYSHVFIGHTTTQSIKIDGKRGRVVPLTFNNLTMMDTGAGWTGKLTIMDVKTRQYWQSERQQGQPKRKTRPPGI